MTTSTTRAVVRALLAMALAIAALATGCSSDTAVDTADDAAAPTADAGATSADGDADSGDEPTSADGGDTSTDTSATTADDNAAPVADPPSDSGGSGGFRAEIDGAVFVTDTHECFPLGPDAIAVSGEGSGPSGPFTFFLQAGLEEELSFQAGDFVVFALPGDFDLRFAVVGDQVAAQATLDPGKVLDISGSCSGPVSEAAAPAPSDDAATSDTTAPGADAAAAAFGALLDSGSGMLGAVGGDVVITEAYGCNATASGGVALSGSGLTDDGRAFVLYLETVRDVASISLDGIDYFASGFTAQGQVTVERNGDLMTAEAVAEDGTTFNVAARVCDGF